MSNSVTNVDLDLQRSVADLTVAELVDIIDARLELIPTACYKIGDFFPLGTEGTAWPLGRGVHIFTTAPGTITPHGSVPGESFMLLAPSSSHPAPITALVTVPVSKRIDLYVGNLGGNTITILINSCIFGVDPGPIRRYTCSGSGLTAAVITVPSSECAIWKVCYVAE